MRPPSLRAQLLRWLLLPLGAIWLVDALLTSAAVRGSLDAVLDRSLYGSALAISEHVALGAGHEPIVDLPPVALEMLDTGEQERVFYRVSYRPSEGSEDRFITGYEDLPLPGPVAIGQPAFSDVLYRDDQVRIVALRAPLMQEPGASVLVEVAETSRARGAMATRLVTRALGSQVALILAAGALVWATITLGLRPLRRVSREVAARSAADLAPLQSEVPREIQPLVRATNGLMERVRAAIEVQRRFIADASHQIRTPLAVIRAEAHAALRLEDPASLRSAIERLRDHSQATAHLAVQLLSLAKAEPGSQAPSTREILDLTAVARDACAALVPRALSRDVDLGFEGSVPVAIHGNPMMLREMLSNLIDNAISYGRSRGRVTVSVVVEGRNGPVLAVEDDGPGIPAAARARVFERFFRLPGTPGTGAGLGLPIVREISRQHGADVQLLDGPGGTGLRVEVRFPVAASRPGPAAASG